MNDLKKMIYDCKCRRCRAVKKLVEEHGADLRFSESRAGRLCELAVVAAEGSVGILESEVVEARRSYAEHLNVQLSGPTSDAELPAHIAWAVINSNHNPDAKSRINLGSAKASYSNGKYFLY